MELSARNLLKGTVKHLTVGLINSEVTIEVGSGVEIAAVITKASSERLGLAVGKQVYAVIKASDVMVAID